MTSNYIIDNLGKLEKNSNPLESTVFVYHILDPDLCTFSEMIKPIFLKALSTSNPNQWFVQDGFQA